jgi:hypothetical protein
MVDLSESISPLLKKHITRLRVNTREKGDQAVSLLDIRIIQADQADDEPYSRGGGGGYGRDRDDRRPYDGGRDRYDDRDRERSVMVIIQRYTADGQELQARRRLVPPTR